MQRNTPRNAQRTALRRRARAEKIPHRPAGKFAGEFTGRIEGHADGHGFLIPDGGGAPVYLSALEMREVLLGDRARVRVTGLDARGRPSGSIVEVTGRGNPRIVGRLREERGALVLVPEDRRIARDIQVAGDGRGNARAGEVVTVEIGRAHV